LSRTPREPLSAQLAQASYYSQQQDSGEDHEEDIHAYLVAAAAATTAGPAATERRCRGFGGSSVAAAICGGEDRKLDAGFLAGALGAGDFLLLVYDNLLKTGFALFAKVFVDGHGSYSFGLQLPVASH
jgi:hypothetical protein